MAASSSGARKPPSRGSSESFRSWIEPWLGLEEPAGPGGGPASGDQAKIEHAGFLGSLCLNGAGDPMDDFIPTGDPPPLLMKSTITTSPSVVFVSDTFRVPKLRTPLNHLFYASVRKATDTEFNVFVLGRDLIVCFVDLIHSLFYFEHLSNV
ncbi:hypothetical protein F511_03179 [Dorcoceras hygrometricum]|uniref:Uncharacterized protein n=1 Tax=Dorcoceras hygrometricum TaxID=472368 RepID=A0A2Z7CV47_9LAMI|nr:hypothetical protein F511_03179 [Dorcoceras hygrometricum]